MELINDGKKKGHDGFTLLDLQRHEGVFDGTTLYVRLPVGDSSGELRWGAFDHNSRVCASNFLTEKFYGKKVRITKIHFEEV